jgi:membrane associated rhomboid family serine protease
VFPLKDNIPTRRFPILTVGLIVANVLMFLVFQGASIGFGGAQLDESRVIEYGAIPYEVTHPGEQCIPRGQALACGPEAAAERAVGEELAPTWLTVLTSMFMHGGLLHLGGNMLFLWIFGNNIEDSMGRVRFLLFYLLGGVAALAAQTAIASDAAVPTIGASGAVAAVLGGYALLYPRARVVTVIFIIFFFQFIELPALVVLGLWFLMQVFFGSAELAQPVAGGGVAYWAHIGGFLFGLVLIKLFADRAKHDYVARNHLPVY